MKNRILWIFDSAEPAADLPELPESNQAEEKPAPADLPWALFGEVGAQQRAELQRDYQLAYEQAQAKQAQAQEEALRFQRLMADLEMPKYVQEK
jgi:hypothetical protein